MTNYATALQKYADISRELASLHKERGQLRSAAARVKHDVWQNAGDAPNVTARREAASHAGARYDDQIELQSADIDALLTELRYLDQYISYLRYQGQDKENG